MTDQEIAKVVNPVLRKSLKGSGFVRADIRSEEDVDGTPIIRVLTHFRNGGASGETLSQALSEIRTKLLAQGEERYVFLGRAPAADEPPDEDAE